MKRDKSLAYRILKLCQIIEWSQLKDYQKTPLLEHKEFSELPAKEVWIHYHLLGDAGCFMGYNPNSLNHSDLLKEQPEYLLLSWKGHDLLETLEIFYRDSFAGKLDT